jgi:hypothetical protein
MRRAYKKRTYGTGTVLNNVWYDFRYRTVPYCTVPYGGMVPVPYGTVWHAAGVGVAVPPWAQSHKRTVPNNKVVPYLCLGLMGGTASYKYHSNCTT